MDPEKFKLRSRAGGTLHAERGFRLHFETALTDIPLAAQTVPVGSLPDPLERAFDAQELFLMPLLQSHRHLLRNQRVGPRNPAHGAVEMHNARLAVFVGNGGFKLCFEREQFFFLLFELFGIYRGSFSVSEIFFGRGSNRTSGLRSRK